MTESDILKLSFNEKTSVKITFIFFIVGSLLIYTTWDKNSLFLKIFFGVFILFGILGILEHFFSQKKKRDLNERIKIIVDTIIIDKKEIPTRETSGDDSYYKTNYGLIFENSKRYEVSNYIFNRVSIGDEIKIEYAKHSKWILKIYSKNLNIENSKCLQKFE